MRSRSEKSWLLPTIAALLAVGFLLTSFTSFFVSRATPPTEISSNELPLTSDNIYSEIQRDLLRPIFISSFMAQDTFLRNWLLQGEGDMGQITQYLREIQQRYQTFTSFLVSEKSRNYYHRDGILKQVRPDEERDRWYFRVREMQPDYEINIDPDQANKDTMTIFINHRVLDYQGRLLGVTGVGLSVGAVKEIIDLYQRKYKRTIYFFDRNRLIRPVQAVAPGGVGELVLCTIFFPNQMEIAYPIAIALGNLVDPPATMVNAAGDYVVSFIVSRFVDGKDWLQKKLKS